MCPCTESNPVETGFYYLNSRYYDPGTGRFINADGLVSTGQDVLGTNMFAYCNNNPVNMMDPEGTLPVIVVGLIVGAVIGGIVGGVVAAYNGENVLMGIAIGAGIGALIGTGLGALAGVTLGGSALASTGTVVAGANTLAATVSAGGLGAGATFIANNVTRALSSSGTVLYSGGQKAFERANEFAKQTGGKVMDMTRIGRMAEKAARANPLQEKQIFGEASARFCQQAKGTVNVFVYNPKYYGVDSIFWMYEMPALASNPSVSEVIIHIFFD